MKAVIVTPPTLEPITLAEAKAHLRLDSSNAEPTPPAPTVALAAAGAGNVEDGVHRYRVTYVTADGETDGGVISDALTVADKGVNGKVSVSAISIGGSAVTSRKLYRTIAAGTTYLLLATIADNTTTTYTDNIADGSLGAAVPSTNTTVDPTLSGFITSARQYVEDFTRRAIMTQTWDYYLDAFPAGNVIVLPFGNLQTVTSVKHKDTAGTETTMVVTTEYLAETNGTQFGGVVLPYGVGWPSGPFYPSNPITVRFVCGWSSAALVPDKIKTAVKMACAKLYEGRGEDIIGQTLVVNQAIESLLWTERLWGAF